MTRLRQLGWAALAVITLAIAVAGSLVDFPEPGNAVAIDRAWNVRLSNRPFDLLVAMTGEDAWARVGGTHRNLMRLLFHPNGIQPLVANWRTIVGCPFAQRHSYTVARPVTAIGITSAPGFSRQNSLTAADGSRAVSAFSEQGRLAPNAQA